TLFRSMIWKRLYEVQTHPLARAYLRDQWRKTYALERASCRRFDTSGAVSRADREMMQREYGLVAALDVPTGVDTEYFRPRGIEGRGIPRGCPEGRVPTRGAPTLLFTGSMDW